MSDPVTVEQAASFGGAGWRPREGSHAEEVAAGRLWAPYRVCSEVETLRAVLLAWPGVELLYDEDPDDWLMLERPELRAIVAQAAAVRDFYRGQGVHVHAFIPARPPPPNFLFQRDLFLMTPEGAILGRPAAAQRAGEERHAAEALAGIGVPILATVRGQATFEGADAIWLRPDRVLVGTGRRTNAAGLEQVRRVLGDLGVDVISVDLPAAVQHLLGVVNLADARLAVVHGGRVTPEIHGVLAEQGIERLVLPPDEELSWGRGLNFVTLGPRRLVMPAGCPGIERRLRAAGLQVHTCDVGEYLKAAGGLGCLTGILWRSAEPVAGPTDPR
jgi:N-dimethylarginine dimethylaminohydrolase